MKFLKSLSQLRKYNLIVNKMKFDNIVRKIKKPLWQDHNFNRKNVKEESC